MNRGEESLHPYIQRLSYVGSLAALKCKRIDQGVTDSLNVIAYDVGSST